MSVCMSGRPGRGSPFFTAAAAALVLLLSTDHARAQQTRPSVRPSGALQRLNKNLKHIPASRESPAVLTRGADTASRSDTAPNFSAYVARFKYVGNTRIGSDELDAALHDLTGRTLTLHDIDRAAEIATALYAAKGYNVARVVVPPQDIVDQTVTLLVLEGYLQPDGLELIDYTEGRGDLAYIESIFSRQIDFSSPIRRQEYERALRLVENLPGVTVRSWLYPGTEVGTARLRTELRPTPRHATGVALDNYGYRPTGSARMSIYSINENVFRQHEELRLDAASSGLDNYYLGTSGRLPVGPDGWMLTASADHLKYNVRQAFSLDDEHGSADHFGFGVSYPLQLLSDVSWVTHHTLNLVRQRDTSNSYGTEVRDARFLESDLVGELFWNADASASTTLRLSVSLGSSQAPAQSDPFHTDGDFAVGGVDLVHIQPVAPQVAWLSQVRAQTASRNLNGYFTCSVGGPYSSRAYPTGQVAADRCVQFNNELFFQPSAAWRFSTFIDWSHSRYHAKHLSDQPNPNDTLASFGLSLTAFVRPGATLSLTVARQIVQSAERESLGYDLDQGTSRYRAWFQGLIEY